MAELSFDFEVFHRVYGFTKAEKRQIFVQLAHFLG
jgi:Holliday junction resolvasome RuvABC DNA-binding subunit